MCHSQLSSNTGKSLTKAMKALLRHWYRKRFVLRLRTSELMETVSSHEDRRALGIVALMDVDALTMTALMDSEEFQFVQSCHAYLSRSKSDPASENSRKDFGTSSLCQGTK